MQIPLLTPQKDPMGAAIADYFANGKASKLRVFSSMFDEDEIPVKQLFRNFTEMPVLEQEALRMSEGRILDVGAGSGCHSLALQEMGKTVKAIDISPLSVEVILKRGCVWMDSSGLRYLFEDEDGNLDIDIDDDYYGEVDFRMQYKNIRGDRFDWLYLDFQTLSLHAANNGFKAEKIREGEHFDYLAKISRI